MKLKQIYTVIIVSVVLILLSVPACAQDLLARQAPVDRRMRTVDTLSIQSIIEREMTENPSAQLYDDWNNVYAHRATELPDSFRINLRNFCMPTTNRVITSKMGPRWGRMHKGLDIKVYIGDTIRAAFSGKVRIKKYERAGYGKYLVIRHNNGLETIYGHMSDWLVEENQVVKAGQPIGLGGNTGRSTGSHLHFETRLCGVALNPALLFDFVNQDVTADYYMFRKETFEHESVAINKNLLLEGGRSNELAKETDNNNGRNRNVREFSETKYHKVSVGETLTSIAKRRGTTVAQLCKLNHLTRDVKVRPGQILRYS
ncbi:MAG: M23 family metallopeptidase [Prevotella sp.]|nr:peptidoglycan DD-metalloendopeptidase family protein [Prevotella sp.]MCI5571452.1 M23 family metallopeptidase [Prevotella sp.]MCI6371166.1 M23 family metallopeptidase [Prevotella sp.]MCI6404498.1 M23 family metallopeptidase [Prevotella sp.]MCI6447434.1 M23 family metallopeptidase [Prevotella sp.]